MILKLAWREVRNNLRFSLFLVLTLAVGLSGFVAVDSMKHSVRSALAERAKGLLAADISVGARRPLTDNELKLLSEVLPAGAAHAELFESYTMLASESNSRLVELKAIEESYPFYGELQLKEQGIVRSTTPKRLFDRPSLWVHPELLIELGLKPHDSVTIGSISFELIDIIEKDSSGIGSGFNFAPSAYVAKRYFEQSGLLGIGATGQFTHLYRLPPATDTEALAERLNQLFADPAVRVTTSKNASEQVGRVLGYLADYLALSGLVALFLMSLGQIFLYRNYLIRRFRDMAILKSLGLSPLKVYLVYNTQILILSLFAIVPTLLGARLLLPLLEGPVGELAQIDLKLSLHPQTYVVVAVLVLTIQTLTLFPLLYRIFGVSPKELLHPAEHLSDRLSVRALLFYLPALMAFWAISMWVAKSFRVGSLFFSLFIVSMIGLLLCAVGMLAILKALPFRSNTGRFAVRNLRRARLGTLAAFVTIGLGALLTNLIPQLRTGLLAEINSPAEQPSLFLFDIQPEQRAELEALLAQEGVRVLNLSPLIRARMVSVNDEPFEKRSRFAEVSTREEENENRFRNRGFNLTWRNKLTASERIVAGKDFSALPSDPNVPRVSVESRFADRLKLKLGDLLKFDIQGVEVQGKIANLRSVRWTSFQPNFFIQFEEGPLNDAPQTFLASLESLTSERKLQVQTAIAKRFPNISSVDISRVVARVSVILEQWSTALSVMGLFCLFVGLTILFSVASYQMAERKREVNLLKVLGAEFALIKRVFLTEFLFIALLASVCGTLLSFALSYTMATLIFDSAWAISFWDPLVIVFGILLSVVMVLSWSIHRVVTSSPRELLQST